MFKLVKTDVFGNSLFIKGFVYSLVGWSTYSSLNRINKLELNGSEILKTLPKRNVLFVCNHQTYFADVIGLLHVFCSAKWGWTKNIDNPLYLFNPEINIYYVAAEETMKENGFLGRLFALAGALTIKRTWRASGREVERAVDTQDIEKITKALSASRVITFPQGTTKPFAPGRKGTAHIIKQCRPLVVPVVINGFRRAFNKKGLVHKKKGVTLQVHFKEPLAIDYDASVEKILEQVMDGIEQSERFKWFFNQKSAFEDEQNE